jgi:hypothetical protein
MKYSGLNFLCCPVVVAGVVGMKLDRYGTSGVQCIQIF